MESDSVGLILIRPNINRFSRLLNYNGRLGLFSDNFNDWNGEILLKCPNNASIIDINRDQQPDLLPNIREIRWRHLKYYDVILPPTVTNVVKTLGIGYFRRTSFVSVTSEIAD